MSFLSEVKQLIERYEESIETMTGWGPVDAEEGRFYGHLLDLRNYCLEQNDSRAHYYFGHTAQLLNTKFVTLMDAESPSEKFMDTWYEATAWVPINMGSYLYPWKTEKPTDIPYGLIWQRNSVPQEARETWEQNIEKQWTEDAVDRWAEQDIEMMDLQYLSSHDQEQFLIDNPYYKPPES